MLLVDTNVLVYAANQDSEFYHECRSKLEEVRARDLPWYLTWPICYEFLRVCTHPNILTKPWTVEAAWRFLQNLLDSPAGGLLLPTMRHENVLREIIGQVPHLRGNIVHDLHSAVLMLEHGIREIYTRDTDFHRFPFLTVIDPTK